MTSADIAAFWEAADARADPCRNAMYDSFLRMIEGDTYEPPQPLFPLYEGMELAREIATDIGMFGRMARWIEAAEDLLSEARP